MSFTECPGAPVDVTEQHVVGMLGEDVIVHAIWARRRMVAVRGALVTPGESSIAMLRQRAARCGWTLRAEPVGQEYLFTVERTRTGRIPWLAIGLFVATALSVVLGRPATMPYRHVDGFLALVRDQLPFAISLFPILLAHEFGHYFAARLHRYPASLPYFLPGIWPFGTFGALIIARHPFRDRRVLFDIAVAGPLAGFLVAVPVVWYGLSQSGWMPASAASGYILWDPLLMKWIASVALPPAPGADYIIGLHPAAFGGWAGLFVTMLNLLPFGPLDGGKASYALLGPKQRWLAYLAWGLLCSTLLVDWFWVLWLGLALVFRLPHPPTLNDASSLGRVRMAVGICLAAVFVLSFMPLPISYQP